MPLTPNSTTLALIALSLTVCGCGTAKVQMHHESGIAPVGRPAVIYVADFDLGAADIQSSSAGQPPLPNLPGPLAEMTLRAAWKSQDPQTLRRRIVDEMSENLVACLIRAGFNAHRLTNTNNLPGAGWFLRGVFTGVSEGNRLQRAVIGFGAGKTELHVVVDIADLVHGAPRSFYELRTAADSGQAPGAGPMVVLCPAGAAARFVIAGKDLDRNVKDTALRIADQVIQRCKSSS